MYRILMFSLLTSAVAVACGSDDPATADAADEADAAPPTAEMVTCPGMPDATVTTDGFAYSPVTTTISVGEVVRFTPASDHDVNSESNDFSVGFGGTACFRFDVVGSYGFECTPHQFTGTIIVQ